MTPTRPFYAAMYIKFRDGRPADAVVSIRGTVMQRFGNMEVDALSWWSDALSKGEHDTLPIYINHAWGFVIKCLKIARRYNLGLKLTGHSLGGAIAQLICLTIYNLRAVTFNAPGYGNMPGVYKDRAGAIHNINSRYGLINKVGLTLGEIYYIDVPNMAADAKQLIQRYQQEVAKEGNIKGDALLHQDLIKVKDYYDAYGTLSADVDRAKIDAKCTSGWLERAAFPAYSAVADYACRKLKSSEAQGSLLAKVVEAQHAIKHVVLTLQDGKYNGIAHRVIF